MRLQNNTISNNHHSLIFLDIDGVINTTFSHESCEENTKPTYHNDSIGQELATFFLANKEDLGSFVVYDDINGDVARLFPNNYLLVDTLIDFDNELCKKVKDIIIE